MTHAERLDCIKRRMDDHNPDLAYTWPTEVHFLLTLARRALG